MPENEHPAWKELRILQDSSMKIWQLYLTWFAWFFGMNVVALSWVLTNDKAHGNLVISLAVLMVLFLVLGIGATLAFRTYYLATLTRADAVGLLMGQDCPDIRLIFGGAIARYSILTHPVGFALEICAWLYVAYIFGAPSPQSN